MVFFPEVRVTTGFLWFSGLFKVFKLILTERWSWWSRFFFWSRIPPVSFPSPREPFQAHRHDPQLFLLSGKIQVFVYPFVFHYFHSIVRWNSKIHKDYKYDLLINSRSVFWLGLGDPFIFLSPCEFYRSHFLGQILVCAYIICLYSQILTYCTIPSGSSFPPSHAYSCIPFESVCCICWLFD